MPREVRKLLLTVRRQARSACGPSALEAVLRFHGQRVPLSRLSRLCRTSSALGTAPENLARAARLLGCGAQVKTWAEYSDLRNALRKRLPPIVLWFSEHEGHYSVVVGLDRRFVHLADPELGHVRTLPRAAFRRAWFDFSTSGPAKRSTLYARWMMVVTPHNRREASPG